MEMEVNDTYAFDAVANLVERDRREVAVLEEFVQRRWHRRLSENLAQL